VVPVIRSHTIPAFYLKQFSSRLPKKKQHMVWVYEKGQDPVMRNIQKQGKQNGYFAVLQHDGSLEDEAPERAITDLENECNDVLFCARSELFDWSSSAHRKKLAFYTAFLYARATQRRSHSELVGKQVHAELAACAEDGRLMEEIANAINSTVRQEVFTPDSVRQLVLDRIQEDNRPAEINTHFVSNLRGLVDYFTGLLLQKRWQMWRSAQGTEFITSDNPVVNFIPLEHGPFHPGHGFNKGMTGFPLAPDACLVMGVPAGAPEWRRVEGVTVELMNEALISICDRYVYSKNHSAEVDGTVQRYAGAFKYGKNALMPVGMKLPSAREFLRRQYGLPPENS
jgi:hypothetical protein